ncbi:hypothetical protein OAM69_06445 [bacterium]|nr:hypothetical protein [bacterium]
MNRRNRRTDHTLLIVLLAVFLFNSPLKIWWSSINLPWYAIFIPWALIIALVGWNQLRQDHGD